MTLTGPSFIDFNKKNNKEKPAVEVLQESLSDLKRVCQLTLSTLDKNVPDFATFQATTHPKPTTE